MRLLLLLLQLMERWQDKLAAGESQKEPVILALLSEFSRDALNVVGKAAFSFEFNAIKEDANPLASAFEGAVAKAFT